MQVDLDIYVFQLNDEEPVEADEEEENATPAYSEWQLPARAFSGLWDSLVYQQATPFLKTPGMQSQFPFRYSEMYAFDQLFWMSQSVKHKTFLQPIACSAFQAMAELQGRLVGRVSSSSYCSTPPPPFISGSKV